MKLFECVPNFSEGRDAARIAAIANAGRGIAGVTLLDIESNPDHNRCVISLVGEADPLLEAVIGMMRVAVSSIDLNYHKGEHPRMGAVDVVPSGSGPSSTYRYTCMGRPLIAPNGPTSPWPVVVSSRASGTPSRPTPLVLPTWGTQPSIRPPGSSPSGPARS
jgi:hypothetical protein